MLVTVKASPEPSKTYIDTVCVAGIRLSDKRPEWVRIYPVAFRHLRPDQQFKKFEVIEVDLTKSLTDSRKESFRPNWETLERVGKTPLSAPARGPILEQLIGPNLCELRAAVKDDLTAPSLGLIEVADLKPLTFEKHGPWSELQASGMAAASQPDILGTEDKTPALEPPRYKVKYKFGCVAPGCPGHEARILDWELNALQYNNRRLPDAELRALIVRKFHEEMWNENVRTYFFVGNFADIVKRRNYSVLGIYKPPRASSWASTLF